MCMHEKYSAVLSSPCWNLCMVTWEKKEMGSIWKGRWKTDIEPWRAQSLNKRLFRVQACRASRCLYSYQAQVMPYQLQSLKYEIALYDKEHLMLKWNDRFTLSVAEEEAYNLHVTSWRLVLRPSTICDNVVPKMPQIVISGSVCCK